MKRFISTLLSLTIILSMCGGWSGPMITIAAAYQVPCDSVIYTYDDMDTLVELIAEQISYMDAAHQMANAARALGYSDDHEVIVLATQEWQKANIQRQRYQAVYDNLAKKWQQKEEEYPVATYIWSYLKDLGYSNQVCAGILGNIMAEVGGQTLDIQYRLTGNGYYGMCQWSKTYSKVWGASLEEQCNYLRDTIEYEFNTFGQCYKKGFNYSQFLAMTDIEKAALAFAKAYERCGSGSYNQRQRNAIVAYNYFVS